MFSAVLGLFSQDLALDLGSSRTRVWQRDAGVVVDIPSAVVIRQVSEDQRVVHAIGNQVSAMEGRTPAHLQVKRPVKAGKLVDYEVVDALLVHILRETHHRANMMRPRMVVAVSADGDEGAYRAVRDSCEMVGCRDVQLVPRPLAAAIGVGLKVHTPAGQLIVDIGAEITEIAVISLNGVVQSMDLPIGSRSFDKAIARHVAENHRVLIGASTAERLKIDLGTAVLPAEAKEAEARGRHLTLGVPSRQPLSTQEVAGLLAPLVQQIADAISTVLRATPPDLAADVVDRGVVLTGGGAKLHGMGHAIRALTGLAAVVADQPDGAVIRGLGHIIEAPELLDRVAC